jgi:cysteine synthase A
VDPENSAFLPGWIGNDDSVRTGRGSRIEGVGRPRVEPSFVGDVVDRMISVPDATSIAAMRHLSTVLGRRVGPSTGMNFAGALQVARTMRDAGLTGSVVTLICDGGDRYAHTYYSDRWVREAGIELPTGRAELEVLLDDGRPDVGPASTP